MFTKEFFEDSSKEWLKNKRKLKSGYYIYRCQYSYKSGRKCNKDVYKDNDLCVQCWALKRSSS